MQTARRRGSTWTRNWMLMPSKQRQRTRRSSLQPLQMPRRPSPEQATRAHHHSSPGLHLQMLHPGAAVQ